MKLERNKTVGIFGVFRDGLMQGMRFLSEPYSVQNVELKEFLSRGRLP